MPVLGSVCSKTPNPRPNILFILSDDYSCEAISVYGGRNAELAPMLLDYSDVKILRDIQGDSLCAMVESNEKNAKKWRLERGEFVYSSEKSGDYSERG